RLQRPREGESGGSRVVSQPPQVLVFAAGEQAQPAPHDGTGDSCEQKSADLFPAQATCNRQMNEQRAISLRQNDRTTLDLVSRRFHSLDRLQRFRRHCHPSVSLPFSDQTRSTPSFHHALQSPHHMTLLSSKQSLQTLH